jgi:hypothetical protein
VDWEAILVNPNAIPLIKQYIDRIPKIDWIIYNTHPDAVELIKTLRSPNYEIYENPVIFEINHTKTNEILQQYVETIDSI